MDQINAINKKNLKNKMSKELRFQEHFHFSGTEKRAVNSKSCEWNYRITQERPWGSPVRKKTWSGWAKAPVNRNCWNNHINDI